MITTQEENEISMFQL